MPRLREKSSSKTRRLTTGIQWRPLPSLPSARSARCRLRILLVRPMRYSHMQTACSNSTRIRRPPLIPRSPCSTSEKRGRNHKHALDLIFSLSLASSCLAYTERAGMLSSVRRKRLESNMSEGDGDPQYQNHLRVLLMDVITRFTEMGRAVP